MQKISLNIAFWLGIFYYSLFINFNLAKQIDSHTNLLILHDVFITVVYFDLYWNFILFD